MVIGYPKLVVVTFDSVLVLKLGLFSYDSEPLLRPLDQAMEAVRSFVRDRPRDFQFYQ